jgi:hypothetical protein
MVVTCWAMVALSSRISVSEAVQRDALDSMGSLFRDAADAGFRRQNPWR